MKMLTFVYRILPIRSAAIEKLTRCFTEVFLLEKISQNVAFIQGDAPTVEYHFDIVEYIVSQTTPHWQQQEIKQPLNLQKTPHGVPFVRIWEKIDSIIMASHWIS